MAGLIYRTRMTGIKSERVCFLTFLDRIRVDLRLK